MFELEYFKGDRWYVFGTYPTRERAESTAAIAGLTSDKIRIVDLEWVSPVEERNGRKRPDFITKDSGQREELANGMVRSPEEDKPDYTLIANGPMFDRWAELLTRGAKIYGKNNWMKALAATDPVERSTTKERYRRSAFRHFRQWLRGDRDEDHAAAVFFNLNGYEAMLATDTKEAQ